MGYWVGPSWGRPCFPFFLKGSPRNSRHILHYICSNAIFKQAYKVVNVLGCHTLGRPSLSPRLTPLACLCSPQMPELQCNVYITSHLSAALKPE